MQSDQNSKVSSQEQEQMQKNLPVAKNEDVEFSSEAADNDDVMAQERAAKANNQQDSSNK